MTIAHLIVTLQGIEPIVSRGLEVPIDIRLDRLHLTIQEAMGWENCHLYEFTAANTHWGLPDPDFGTTARPVNKATLAEVIDVAGKDPIRYTYDFGDDWVHLIVVDGVSDPIPGNLYPRLIDITGRCPPEDVGGLPGYEHFLEVMRDTTHDEYDALMRWSGGHFDPRVANSDELRLEVLKLGKKWKPRRS